MQLALSRFPAVALDGYDLLINVGQAAGRGAGALDAGISPVPGMACPLRACSRSGTTATLDGTRAGVDIAFASALGSGRQATDARRISLTRRPLCEPLPFHPSPIPSPWPGSKRSWHGPPRDRAVAAAGPALWPSFARYYQGLTRLPRSLRRALQRQWRRSLGGLCPPMRPRPGAGPLAAPIAVEGTSCTLNDAITADRWMRGGCNSFSVLTVQLFLSLVDFSYDSSHDFTNEYFLE